MVNRRIVMIGGPLTVFSAAITAAAALTGNSTRRSSHDVENKTLTAIADEMRDGLNSLPSGTGWSAKADLGAGRENMRKTGSAENGVSLYICEARRTIHQNDITYGESLEVLDGAVTYNLDITPDIIGKGSVLAGTFWPIITGNILDKRLGEHKDMIERIVVKALMSSDDQSSYFQADSVAKLNEALSGMMGVIVTASRRSNELIFVAHSLDDTVAPTVYRFNREQGSEKGSWSAQLEKNALVPQVRIRARVPDGRLPDTADIMVHDGIPDPNTLKFDLRAFAPVVKDVPLTYHIGRLAGVLFQTMAGHAPIEQPPARMMSVLHRLFF